jgi:two-component system, OmpR family, alkaline phosphatase synthesis response regulator PhoP
MNAVFDASGCFSGDGIMSKQRILAVDDEEDIRELVRYNLDKEGFDVSTAETGERALDLVRTERFDLVLLDLMLPGMDGFEVCRILKRDAGTSPIPIVILSAKGEETDIVAGLELGAEDYVTKPFSPRVLTARVRAALRRHRQASGPDDKAVYEVHSLVIDPGRFEVRVEGRSVDLTRTEFTLLQFLSRHPGWVFTRSQIIDSIKGADYAVTDRSVDVQIVGLRKKLGSAGKYIVTVHGVGYRFME